MFEKRDQQTKEFEGMSLAEMRQRFDELLAYKKSPQILEDVRVHGQEVMSKTNQRIHALRYLIGTREREELRKELDEMIEEYSQEDPVEEKTTQLG